MKFERLTRWRPGRASVAGTVAALLLVMLLGWHRVDNALNADDLAYIPKYLEHVTPALASEPRYFDQEIELVRAVQQAVLTVAPEHRGVPRNAAREPRDLYEAAAGLCYDRSRVIEKVLRYAGFQTRHISMYSTVATGSAVRSLANRRNPSHAISEVLTGEGWLVVDSNDPWLSLDADGLPVTIATIRAAAQQRVRIAWQEPTPSTIYDEPFVAVYGLYSRHGRFYAPYNALPDVHYGEFAYNVGWLTAPADIPARLTHPLPQDGE